MAANRFRARLCRVVAATCLLALAGHPALAQTPIQVPLVNPSLEAPGLPVNDHNGQTTGTIANGWYDNDGYGDATAVYALDSTNPHGGAACQDIAVTAVRSGNLQMVQGVPLKGGSLYTIGSGCAAAPARWPA